MILRAVPVGASLALSPPLVITAEEVHEMFDRVKDSVQGVQVSAPFGKVDLALQVFDRS